MTSADEALKSTTSPAKTRIKEGAGLAIVLLFAALNLRIAVAAISPVLDDIERDTGISAAIAGLLNTVPVVCYGLFALATPLLIRQFGMRRLLLLTMTVITAGIALRLWSPLVALFAGTAIIGAGIAVGNVVVPGLIKQDFSRRAGLMTGLYSVSLFLGAASSAGFTVPLEHATGLGWRPAIALWGIPAILAIAILAPHAAAKPAAARTGPPPSRPKGLWSDRLAWMVTCFMGLQSLLYYSLLAWLPTLLEARHMSASQAGWMLSYSSFPALVAALVAPILIRGRVRRARILVIAAVVLCACGYLGLATAPVALPYVWLTLLGFGQGMCLGLALSFIVARAPDVHHTAHLSTMAQSVGYLIASVGPFGLGALHDLTGGWAVPMLALIAALVPLLIAGLGASRDRHILSPVHSDNARMAMRSLPSDKVRRMPLHHAVLLSAKPAHGYELKSSFEQAVGDQWGGLNIGHLYQILDRWLAEPAVPARGATSPTAVDSLLITAAEPHIRADLGVVDAAEKTLTTGLRVPPRSC